MKIFKSFQGLPADAQNAVMVIGNFDGVHRGHRTLIAQARDVAQKLNVPVAVMTFEPHPRVLFRPDDPVFRITPEAVKQRLLADAGVDILYNLAFDWDFASLTPQQFIDQVLKSGVKPAHIIVGDDFHFGQLRKGTAQTLRDSGLPVTVVDKIVDEDGADVSSSAIRRELQFGNIDAANALLGWEWFMEGIVQHGDQRGRTIGYPTANVPLGDTLHPAYGIYACMVKIGDENIWRRAATNIGIRPMFELQVGQIESYIFDFDRDIYGQTMTIKPVKRLRGEAKFDSLEALITQIELDCAEARTILEAYPV